MKIHRRWFLGLAVVLLPLFLLVVVNAKDDRGETAVRWDIVLVGGGNLRAGGSASALNNIDAKITVTGSGTFVPGEPNEVTGGGDFKIVSKTGQVISTGTYRVTRLVSFEVAPGTLPALNDQIGDPNNARAGLAVLRIRYSDGRRGILVVSCHLVGTPDPVFEGITASHAFADFWNRQRPNSATEPFVDANRTVFHIVPEAED